MGIDFSIWRSYYGYKLSFRKIVMGLFYYSVQKRLEDNIPHHFFCSVLFYDKTPIWFMGACDFLLWVSLSN